MKKEITTVSSQDQAPESPGLIAINGGLSDVVSYNKSFVFQKIQEFTHIKNTEAFSLHLPLDTAFNSMIKRSMDIVLSSVIIILFLSWLIPLIALLIKLDSKGPVFFLQKRNKKNGQVFTCIKFRSMVVNEQADTEPARVCDRRITRVGRFLRNHFLDELPQFFNVLIGDMSVIGPRPHMISDNLKYEDLIDYYNYRHNVRPGITGISQVLGYVGSVKNIQAMKDRVQTDIFYTRHWSFWLDLKILLYTLRRFAGL